MDRTAVVANPRNKYDTNITWTHFSAPKHYLLFYTKCSMSNTKAVSEASPLGKFYLSKPHVQAHRGLPQTTSTSWGTAMWLCGLSSTLPDSGGHTPASPAWVAAKPGQFSHSLITGGPAGRRYSELPVTWSTIWCRTLRTTTSLVTDSKNGAEMAPLGLFQQQMEQLEEGWS